MALTMGIDVGSSTVRIVELRNKNVPVLERFIEAEIPPGAVDSGQVVNAKQVTSVIKAALKTGQFQEKKAVLGIGHHRILVRQVTLPRMENIRDSLSFLVQDMIPVNPADCVLDFFPISYGQGVDGATVSGLLVAVLRDSVLENVRAVEAAGVKVTRVDLIPFALVRSLHPFHHMNGQANVVILDVGESSSSITVSIRGVPQIVRLVPFGVGNLTRAIRERIAMDRANSKVQTPGQIPNLGGIAGMGTLGRETITPEILTQASSDFFTNVKTTVNYFLSSNPGTTIDTILISGGGAQVLGFPEALSYAVGMPVQRGNCFSHVDLSRTARKENADLRSNSLAVAVGLAMGEEN